MQTIYHILIFILFLPLIILFHSPVYGFYAMNPPSHYNAPGNPGGLDLTESVANDLLNLGVQIVRIEILRKIYADSADIDYSIYDTIYSRMSSRNIEVMWLIDYQTVGQYSGLWNEPLDASTTNVYIRDFTDKLEEIALHYQGRVKYWQIWNEPNLCHPGYCPYLTTTTFAALLRASYDTLKSIDTGNIVITGGLGTPDSSGNAARDYLNAVYQTSIFSTYRALNGIYPMDKIAHHPYVSPASQVANNLQTVYSAMTGNNDFGRKIWVTEIGWPTQGAFSVTESVQSTYLYQSYQDCLNLTVGTTQIIEQVFWFKYNDNPDAGLYFGLRRSDNSIKPGYYAYKSLANPPISDITTGQINAILNRPDWYTCCTTLSDFAGYRAFDGIVDDSGSLWKWATGDLHDVYGGVTVQHWLVVDLGENYSVNSIIAYHAPAEPNYVQTELAELQKADSMTGPWTTFGIIDQQALGIGNYLDITIHQFEPPVELRYFRFKTQLVNWAHPPNVGYLDSYVRLNEIELWCDDPELTKLTDWYLY